MKTGLLVLLTLNAMTMAALGAENGDVRRGRDIARHICAECHAVRPAERASPNRNAPSFEDIAGVPGMSPIALKVALRTSHEQMPNLILINRDLDGIVAYILSLQGARR